MKIYIDYADGRYSYWRERPGETINMSNGQINWCWNFIFTIAATLDHVVHRKLSALDNQWYKEHVESNSQ